MTSCDSAAFGLYDAGCDARPMARRTIRTPGPHGPPGGFAHNDIDRGRFP